MDYFNAVAETYCSGCATFVMVLYSTNYAVDIALRNYRLVLPTAQFWLNPVYMEAIRSRRPVH